MATGIIKTEEEIQAMREGGALLSTLLSELSERVVPGVTTRELEEYALAYMKKAGVEPAFLGYMGYSAAVCVSVNQEIVHGPATRDITLKEGDVVSVDSGIVHKGMITDSARTVVCGQEDSEKQRLIDVCTEALAQGIAQVRDGAYTGDIGQAVQEHVEGGGFHVVRDLVGHGVGHEVHEEPQVPNSGQEGGGTELKVGMTICIEPMITVGSPATRTLEDGWTIETQDGSLAAHVEHTVLVTEDGAEILT